MASVNKHKRKEPDNSMKRRIIIIIFIIVAIVAALLLVARKKQQLAEAPHSSGRPLMVETALSNRGELTQSRTYLGNIAPWQRSEISSRITATVREVRVREGEKVNAGQILIELDDNELSQATQSAEARLENARRQADAIQAQVKTLEESRRYWQKEYKRDRILAKEGAIAKAQADASSDRLNRAQGELASTRASLQAAQSLVRSQQKQLAEVRSRLGYATLHAPFDGIVARRQIDSGDLATPGRSLVTVEDHQRLKILFDVPQNDLSSFDSQQKLIFASDGQELELQVARSHPSLNDDRTQTMEIDLPADSIFIPGSYVQIKAALKRVQDAVLVPTDSLVPAPDKKTIVFIIKDGKTQAQPVEILLTHAEKTAVKGLKEGETVVRSTYLGWNRLSNGMAVESKP